MFTRARIQLSVWYLVIIMAISLSFSCVIYFGINNELTRIENFQKVRIQRIEGNLPTPFEIPPQDVDAINEARNRIILTLGFINLSILFVSTVAGYFLAGRTLEPIAEMVDEQKDFVSNASHELRTPLTSLKTEIEVALRDKKMTSLEMKKLLASNLEDVNRMQKLSNYLLKLNKYENSKGGISMSKLDLKEVVEKAVKSFDNKNIKTDLKKSIVVGNEDSLVELVTILLDNALKYSPKNKNIEVRTKNGGILEVEDRGVGISKEDLPHIFDRFYRSDKSRSKDGYGLGLSIAKNIVGLHKGRIEVRSKLGKGTTFTIQL